MSWNPLRLIGHAILMMIMYSALPAFADDGASVDPAIPEKEKEKDATWNIETAPGKVVSQPIDTTEGTWITVDVHPEGTKLVFDVLGDLYEMPIAGADGQQLPVQDVRCTCRHTAFLPWRPLSCPLP